MMRATPQARRPAPTPWGAAVALAAAGLVASSAHAQLFRWPVRAVIAPAIVQPADWMTILGDPLRDRPTRLAAAMRLVEEADNPAVGNYLTPLLAHAPADAALRSILLDALARSSGVDPSLQGSVLALADKADVGELPAVIPALGAFQTIAAAERLVAFLRDPNPPVLRAAAAGTLARLSGLDGMGQDSTAWSAWLERCRTMSAEAWAKELARNLGRRSDRLASDRDVARDHLAQLFRRYYLDQPVEDRPALLAELLLDDRDELRSLGFDLVQGELAAGTRLNGQVAGAAVRLLANAQPKWRQRAAALLDQLAPPDAGRAITSALQSEANAGAAAAMLSASVRWPSADLVAPMVRWINEPSVRGPASTAGLALLREGLLSVEARAAIGAALSAPPPEALSPAALRLLVAVGDDQARERIATLLGSSAIELRQAAAESLGDRPEFLDRLVQAARGSGDLYAHAAASAVRHRPSAAGYWAIASLPAPSPAARREALTRIADRLPIEDLVAVAEATADDAEQRALILVRLTTPGAATDPTHDEAMVRGLVLLARTRLELGQPDAALTALDAVTGMKEASSTAETVLSLRATALVCLNRLDQAGQLNADADAWLDGLELSVAQTHAPAIIGVIRAAYGEALTDEQGARLARLTALVRSPLRSPPTDGSPTDPPTALGDADDAPR